MNSYYENLCKEYKSGDDLMKAIVSNRTVVYYYLTQILISGNNSYWKIENTEGKNVADQILTETLLVFRRQIKNNKVTLRVQERKIFTQKENLELSDYLSVLFLLIVDSGVCNPFYGKSHDFELTLISGQGFHKVYELKESILGALQNFGCKDSDDKEEIFDESLLVLWKKLQEGEIGIYFTANNSKLENCRVFNRKYYQNCKLGTYLSGIAKNIFLNRTRTSAFRVSQNKTSEITDYDEYTPSSEQADTPALFLFLFYRNMVEDRKLRTIISLLQYDCNLEDKEVRQLTGIANTRIHSSRLRAHFSDWYYKNIQRIPELLDAAHGYLVQRELKKEKLNGKIRAIDLYRRASLNYLDLNVFKEEFRTIPEFRQYFRIFRYIFYFTSVGKPSALSGLPDEKMMRSLFEIYKSGLYNLSKCQAILFLLFYGSDEPVEIIINLLKCLKQELLQQDQDSETIGDLSAELQTNSPDNEILLKDQIYNTNRGLFTCFSNDTNFTNLIYENETV